jgi:tRNA(Ile)-lysidine synthase
MNLKIKIKANQPARSLKYIFQENKIPPWERENYPCLYVEDKLIAVIGLADSVEYAANKKQTGVVLSIKKIPAVLGFNSHFRFMNLHRYHRSRFLFP